LDVKRWIMALMTYLSYCFLDNCTFLFEWNNCTKLLKYKESRSANL
jgi:hypothetical protein